MVLEGYHKILHSSLKDLVVEDRIAIVNWRNRLDITLGKVRIARGRGPVANGRTYTAFITAAFGAISSL